jgi:two-component system NtrC family response regulator
MPEGKTLMADILIIDDDRSICKALEGVVRRMGHKAAYAVTLKEGLHMLSLNLYDVVFLDVRLPDGSGLDALPEIRRVPISPEVIIITGEGDPDGAELAIKCGAWDYIEKPFSIETMSLPLKRALQYQEEKRIKKSSYAINREHIIGDSSQIKHCFDLLAQAAQSDASVLITGETGTGKELFANAIHENSVRSSQKFVVVDCGAMPKTLVESVLFGHEKGAFTGADRASEGLVKQADGGTLFLDEVGELPMSIQRSFLRVLQERRFRPVGGRRETESDFRLITATHRDLDHAVQYGKFRQDLLFRIRSIVIELPPLRERVKDIKQLAMHFMTKFCDRYEIATKGFSPEFNEVLSEYAWPGNVRELDSCLKSILTTAGDSPTLYARHLPTYIRAKMARESVGKKDKIARGQEIRDSRAVTLEKFKDFRAMTIEEAEKAYLRNLMSLTQWNIPSACQMSGLSRPRLYALLKKHEITRA